MKYRKKPIVIEAYQWDPAILGFTNGIELLDVSTAVVLGAFTVAGKKCVECNRILAEHGKIKTLEGFHIVCPGDWIITGIEGEEYPCKPGIFEKTYELEPFIPRFQDSTGDG